MAYSQRENKETTQSRTEAALWFNRIAFLALERCKYGFLQSCAYGIWSMLGT